MWKIWHKDGREVTDRDGKEVEVHELTYDGEWMGECTVTVDVENDAPVDFEVGDYIEYRGETFVLGYDPGKTKQGRRGAVGDAFRYEGVKFHALTDEMARAEFLDVVLGDDNQMHYTALPDFSFYIETLDDLLDRLQANMDEQTGNGKWKFYSRNWARSKARGCSQARWEEAYGGKIGANGEQTGVEDNEISSTVVSIKEQTVWEGLALVNSQFDVNFITRNREAFVGTAGLPTRNIFRYGKGNGLYEIEQNADSDQKIVTRMRAYGSDKNLPTRYYATLNMEVWAKPGTVGELTWAADGKEHRRIDFAVDLNAANISAYFKTVKEGESGAYRVRVKVGEMAMEGTVRASTDTATEGKCVVTVEDGEGQTEAEVREMQTLVAGGARVYFASGANKANWPDGHKDYATQNLPDNMACDRLMLPGFPNESLKDWWEKQSEETKKRLNPTGAELRFSEQKDRPWVESGEADKVGVKPGSVFFDTADTKNKIEEIYPTIEEATVGGARVDVIAKGTEVEDNGVFKDGQDVAGCTVELPEALDIDINDLKESDFSIVMKTGMCAGRTFKVGGSVKKGGRWVLTLQRAEDGGIYYPYRDFQIEKGDEYVLTGIEMPTEYVEWAAEKLLRYAIAWLVENDHTRYTYSPRVDEIFMARQHDEATADKTGGTKSLHDTLKEGDIMQFEDEDLGLRSANVIIDKLSIKEQDGRIPTYDITLRDDKEVGTLQRMQEQITALANGNGKGSGATAAQMKELVASEGGKYFLSKLKDDTAQGLITFVKGLVAEEMARLKQGAMFGESYASGLTGFGGRIDGRGVGELEALRLRSWLEVPELRYNRVSVYVGNQWRAPGGGVIEKVVVDVDSNGAELEKGVAYLKLEDGEIGKIAENDICMGIWHDGVNTENNATEDADDGKGNFKVAGFGSAYFCVTEVMSVDGGTNNAFRYILRNTKDWEGRLHPKAGMNFVAYGNFTNTKRQSSRYSALTYERYLQKVDDWTFTDRNIGAQFGDLSNLKIYGLDMTGYSAYLNNIYMAGTIQQFEKWPLRMEIENSLDGFLAWGETCTLTCRIMKGWEERTGDVKEWSVERTSGDGASDKAWALKDKVKNFEGSIDISHGSEEDDLGGEISTLFTFRAVMKGGEEVGATVEI